MENEHTNSIFESNDERMFRTALIGYEHSKKSSQKVLFESSNLKFNVAIVHFISFDETVDDCCILHVINNETGDVQINMPSNNFRKLLKHAEAFSY